MKLTQEEGALIEAAINVREHSYSPYSHFKVGAALRLRDGRVFVGTNVENASYGLTVCAERNAVAAAVAGGAKPGDVAVVAIAAEADAPTPPCGACRQVLAEVAPPETPILMHNVRDGSCSRLRVSELLPSAFVPASLKR